MTAQLKSSFQFLSLDQKKILLNQRMGMGQRLLLNRQRLASKLVAFVLAQDRAAEINSAEPHPTNLLTSVEWILARKGNVSGLTLSDLTEVHAIMSDESFGHFRSSAARSVVPLHEPLSHERVLPALKRFFEWLQSPAFGELHAIEQMTLSQIRLYEIVPFDRLSSHTCLLFSVLFPLLRDYMLPGYEASDVPSFYDALNSAYAFSTQKLIQFNAAACEHAYDAALRGL
ncbi:MAG: hypothetical protein HY645_14455 [Acidobacteria bacterium]|nr:hypothetical protein [Acidobacteriota bacterium]